MNSYNWTWALSPNLHFLQEVLCWGEWHTHPLAFEARSLAVILASSLLCLPSTVSPKVWPLHCCCYCFQPGLLYQALWCLFPPVHLPAVTGISKNLAISIPSLLNPLGLPPPKFKIQAPKRSTFTIRLYLFSPISAPHPHLYFCMHFFFDPERLLLFPYLNG